jgi:hypothetical protein
MPRVIVITNPSQLPRDASVLLDEQVHTVNLSSEHSAAQLVERIAWAITDAEDAESHRRPSRLSDSAARARTRTQATRSSGTRRLQVAAH